MNIEDPSSQFLDSIPKIRVVIRKRPLTKRELAKNEQDVCEVRGTQSVIVRETKQKVDLTKYMEEHLFNFDLAFDETTNNHALYGEAVRPLVDALFLKAKCTCFAYGQTGSGKTFTMMGNPGDNKENQGPIPGLYLLAAQDVFALLDQQQFRHLGVYISFYEIYCGKLHDLLNDRQEVFAREDSKKNVNIVGLAEKKVMNVHSLMQIIDFGNSVRTTGSTSANLDSSRSHAILQITLKENNKPYGKLSFIDLAGSERGADVAETNKQTRMDGAEINKSLLALKECIRALDQDKKHTPFRGSKLTLVLKDSFTGNCKTVMIGNISPSSASCEHTLNTLRYADRVKELKKPGGDSGAPMSQLDLLAKQLMLPRMQKNTTRIMMKEDDDENTESSMPIPQMKGMQSDRMSNMNNNLSKGRVSTPSLSSVSTNSSFSNVSANQGQRPQQQGMLNNGLNVNHNSLTTGVYNMYNHNNSNWNPNKVDSNGLFNNLGGNGFNNFQQGQNSQNFLMQNNSMGPGNQFQNSDPRLSMQPQHQQQKFQGFSQQQQQQMPQQQQQFQQRQQQFQNFSMFSQQQQQQQQQYQAPQQQFQAPQQQYQAPQQQMFFNQNNSSQMSIENRPIENKPMKDIGNIYNPPQLTSQNSNPSKPFNGGLMAGNNQNFMMGQENKPFMASKENTINFSQAESFTANSPNTNNIISDTDLHALNQKHEEIINTILAEEEEIISIHRQHIDDTVEITRQEMAILHEVEKPASDIDNYVTNLENILNYKLEAINALKSKVLKLKDFLREEEQLSKRFYEQRNEAMDIFDLNEGQNYQNNDDGLLVDNI